VCFFWRTMTIKHLTNYSSVNVSFLARVTWPPTRFTSERRPNRQRTTVPRTSTPLQLRGSRPSNHMTSGLSSAMNGAQTKKAAIAMRIHKDR
jgi:hypothetical protein